MRIQQEVIDGLKGMGRTPGLYVLILLGSAALKIGEILNAFGYRSGSWAVLVGAVVAVVYFRWKGSGFEKFSLPGPMDSAQFYPFIDKSSPNQRRELMLKRNRVDRCLRHTINKEKSRHLVVVGNSGAGKTVLFNEFVFFDKDSVFLIDEYDRFSIGNLIRCILTDVCIKNSYKLDVEACVRKIMGSGDEALNSEGITSILSDMPAVAHPAEKLIYVVFDQAERIIAKFDHGDGNKEKRAFELFAAVVAALRKLECVRTVFLIGSEYAVHGLGVISRMEELEAHSGLDTIVRYYYYEGLKLEHEDIVYNALEARLSKLGKRKSGRSILDKMSKDGRGVLNAFNIQLFGYIVESFYEKDKWITKLFDTLELDDSIVRDRFWYYLREEYNRIAGNRNAEKILFIVLYTVSAYNKAHGAPLNVEELAILSGLTSEDIGKATEYLLKKGVLKRVDGRVHQEEIRLVHDVLRDYFLTATYPKVRNAYRDAIRVQIEQNSVTPSQWVAPVRSWFVDEILILKSYAEKPHFLIIVLMMVLCLARLLAPEYISPFYQGISDRWTWASPWVQANNYDQFGYAPKMLSQFLWVTFMYNFYENYFRDNLGGGRTWARRIAISAAPVGAIFGGITAFSPALFIIPITVGGSMLAITYGISIKKGYLKGLASQMARELGYKTGINMVLTIGFTGILMILYYYEDTRVYAGVISIFFASGFVYFYYMMQPRQNSAEGWGEFIVSGRIPTTL